MSLGRRGLKVIAGGRGTGATVPARAPDVPPVVGAALANAAADKGHPRAGDGLPELYSKYGGSVYNRCHYLLKDPAKAEDAMQDVFAKALLNATGFRAEASPLTWLTKIATNHCLNLLRSERAPWRQSFADQEEARVDREQRSGSAAGPRLFENREAVRLLLAGVDIETQTVAIHYYVDEMTLEEVAATLGRSVPTVRKRLATFAAQGGQGAAATDAEQGSIADD